MIEWGVPASPPGKTDFLGPFNSPLWAASYPASINKSWNNFSILQPSSSIWGPQIQETPRAYHPREEAFYDDGTGTAAVPRSSIRYDSGDFMARQRRLSSVSSLSTSIHSNSSFRTDSLAMTSPPSSPETSATLGDPPSPGFSISAMHAKLKSRQLQRQHLPELYDDDKFSISPSTGPLYIVQFKGGRADVYTASGTSYYAPGDLVMVDADRGSDLGEIIQVNVSRHDVALFKRRQQMDRSRALNGCNAIESEEATNAEPVVFVPKQIINAATEGNIKDLEAKARDEASAVAVCNAKVLERGLDMTIVDAEYQWDRRKLTFFYSAEARVDFRDLVRDLFRVYKTRIWMCTVSARC